MIYIITNQENVILTDSWFNYIPEVLNVYINDDLLGEFINESSDINYFKITIPEIPSNFQLIESKLRWFSNGVLLKEELCSIKSNKAFSISSTNKSDIKYYE